MALTGEALRAQFAPSGGGPAVLPVIHVRDKAETRENLRVAEGEGVSGVFLINHDFGPERFLPIIEAARAAAPDLWLGVNFLAEPLAAAAARLGALAAGGCRVDGYWADDARIQERAEAQPAAEESTAAAAAAGWRGLYFGGVAFKKQRPVAEADWGDAARRGAAHMDVVTTSGVATGEAADTGKIARFRDALGGSALAVASGITPENAQAYGAVDAFLVATGINRPGDFYRIEPERLRALMAVCARMGERAHG
ncbi:MAG: adenine phosphoribosyltransferase [Pseudomonadota bacterium]